VTLSEEYANAHAMGLNESELRQLVANSFEFAFLAPGDRACLNLGPA